MISALKSDGITVKTPQEVVEELSETELYKANITPTKSDLLTQVKIDPRLPIFERSWLRHYLYSRISWIYGSAHLIANSASSAGVIPIPKAKRKNKVEKDVEAFVDALNQFFAEVNIEQSFGEIYKQGHIDLATEGRTFLNFKFPEVDPPFSYPIALYHIDYRTIKAIRLDQFMSHFDIDKSTLPIEMQGLRNPIIAYCQQVVEDLETFIEPIGKKAGEMPSLYNAPWIYGNPENVRYFHPDEILEIKLDSTGVSPLDPLEYSLATEIASQKYTYAYFKNSTKTGMVFALEQGTKADVARNKERLKEEYANPELAWQPMILFGNIRLVRDSANTSDVQYLNIRQFNREEVCATMGTYPSLLGQSSARGVDKEEDKSSFEEETVRPRSKLYLSQLTRRFYRLFPNMKGKFELVPGVKGRSSLHLMKIAQMQMMCGGTPNESRSLMGLPEDTKDELNNSPFVASNLVPINMLDEILTRDTIAPAVATDDNPGQPRSENPQGGKSGRTNEQRGDG